MSAVLYLLAIATVLAPSAAALSKPLNLTQVLLEEGADAARDKAKVDGLSGWNHSSYSGFFHTETGKMMFGWYFEATAPKAANPPLLIWLQGGPGGSSMFALFAEMGPFSVDADGLLTPRETSWAVPYDMLFIDNPVGAGFSFADTDDDYCTDTKDCVARNLYSLLTQFYQIFPTKLNADLYITGESYGGHYVPAFGAKIVEENKQKNAKVPLAGVAVGDGWIDPINMIPGYPEFFWNIGVSSVAQKAKIQEYCDSTVKKIEQGDLLGAFEVWDEMLNGDVWPYANYFHNISGSNDYDNFMNTNAPPAFDYYGAYVTRDDVREALHVGDTPFGVNASDCETHLLADFHVSYRPELETILNASLKVLLYSGQLDVIIASALTERALPFLNFPTSEKFAAAPRKVWRIHDNDAEVAGFAQTTPDSNLARVVVRGAGHIVPGDQPDRALDMITRFVEDLPYSNQPNPKAA